MKPKITAVMLAGLVFSGPLSAHHAARMFETATPIRVKGTVVRYRWANPHSAIIVEQKTEDGKTIRWALESSAPIRVLESRGFNKDSFKPGEVIEACGFAPRSAFRSRTETANQDASRGPAWLDGANRVITARLLLTQDGPRVHWSHYGPWNYASVRKSWKPWVDARLRALTALTRSSCHRAVASAPRLEFMK